MFYENEVLKVSVTVPDKLSVRKRLIYAEILGSPKNGEKFIKGFEAAKAVVEKVEIKNPAWPDPANLGIDLDSEQHEDVYLIIMWIAGTVANHIAGIDSVPKN